MGEVSFKKVFQGTKWFKQAILLGYRGSVAHGTYVPHSDPNSIDDKDVMGIVIPSIDHYFGIQEWGSRGTREIKKNEWDIVIYELRKMVSLLCKGNPNVLCMLWLQPEDYIKLTPGGKRLIESRKLFSTRQAYHSFSGYAYGQLHRITHYAFEGYMGEKRKSLVLKYGYDCKNASHLIRILRMGIEFMQEGRLYVKREDASQLLEIKRGEWMLDKVKQESDRLFRLAEESYMKSSLPAEPDIAAVNEVCRSILTEYFEESN